MHHKTRNLYLLFVILFSLFLLIVTYYLPQKQTVLPQLSNKCSVNQEQVKNKEYIKMVDRTKGIMEVPYYTFRFPFSQWMVNRNLVNQFEEGIIFPHAFASYHFAYPASPQALSLENDNQIAFNLIIKPDYCVSVEEWFAKIPYGHLYQKSYATYHNIPWLIATREDTIPLQTIAMTHSHGYHYEFVIIMRDKQIATKYKDLLDKTLATFEKQKPKSKQK